jgi:hypothetical protein
VAAPPAQSARSAKRVENSLLTWEGMSDGYGKSLRGMALPGIKTIFEDILPCEGALSGYTALIVEFLPGNPNI